MDKSNKKVHIKRRSKRRKVCIFCIDKIKVLDYKNIDYFKRFTSERGKIVPKRNSGVCAKHQRLLANAIKRARYIGLIPFLVE
jgi:small subunit ribosomal protein S18